MRYGFHKVLVTGGAGFFGSHLTGALLAAGCAVSVLDNLSTGHLRNLDKVKNQISFYQGDIRDPETVNKATAGCDTIFHLAAMVSVPQTIAEPLESARINDLGTLHIFEAARRTRAKRVVFASSSAVYGDDPQLPKREDMNPKPLSPYAVQKLSGEYYAHLYHKLYGIKTTSLRLFNVFGPRQDPSSPYSGVISIFMSKALSKTPPSIYGDGSQRRDFVYVKDVVNAGLLAANADNVAGISINVGTGRSIDINRLWDMICQMTGIELKPQYTAPRPGDIPASVADIQRLESVLDYRPRYDFAEGLQQTFEWYKNNRQ
jgi:UDP-glucose 4-epimerase